MADRSRITVTFYNVKVQTVYDQNPIKAQATVTDTGVTGPASKYDPKTVITVMPPTPSVVTLNRSTAEENSMVDLEVTYTVKDTLYKDNSITIGLPSDWVPYYVPHDETATYRSFGDTALTAKPRSRSNITSYVVVTTSSDVMIVDGDSDTTQHCEDRRQCRGYNRHRQHRTNVAKR